MSVKMNLVRADPVLGLTPNLMEAAEVRTLDLSEYISLLLKDLIENPQPLPRALKLAREGRVALARRFIAHYKLGDEEQREMEACFAEVAQATSEIVNQLTALFDELYYELAPAIHDRYRAREKTVLSAVQRERYDVALREAAELLAWLRQAAAAAAPKERAVPSEEPQEAPWVVPQEDATPVLVLEDKAAEPRVEAAAGEVPAAREEPQEDAAEVPAQMESLNREPDVEAPLQEEKIGAAEPSDIEETSQRASEAPAKAADHPAVPAQQREPKAVELEDLVDQAIGVWGETFESLTSPVKDWLKPSVSPKESVGYDGVYRALQSGLRPGGDVQQKLKSAITWYFFLDDRQRKDLNGLFFQAFVVYAVESLKDLISIKDFDSAILVHDDALKVLNDQPQLTCPGQVFGDFCRWAVEVYAAFAGWNLARSFTDFSGWLSAQVPRLPRPLSQEKTRQLVNHGSVLFFYHRTEALEEDPAALIAFYTEHNPLVAGLARGEIELNRVLEIAHGRYDDALIKQTDIDASTVQLPPDMNWADVPDYLRSLTFYTLVPGLRSVCTKFRTLPAATTGGLLHMYRLLLTLLELEKAEELVFAREQIFDLCGRIRATSYAVEDQWVLLDSTSQQRFLLPILDILERFVNDTLSVLSNE